MLANQIGLSTKVVSERHFIASQTKYTAGEVAKLISKTLKLKGNLKASAKEVISAFKLLRGREPEWHHSGFYKGKSGSIMGRTFFFCQDDVDYLTKEWMDIMFVNECATTEQIQTELAVKKETIVKGFYYEWDHDYSGNYGRKVNFKVLRVYEGCELNTPRNFTRLEDHQYFKATTMAGKKYYGWDEPKTSDFYL
jgi:hypothetical protein